MDFEKQQDLAASIIDTINKRGKYTFFMPTNWRRKFVAILSATDLQPSKVAELLEIPYHQVIREARQTGDKELQALMSAATEAQYRRYMEQPESIDPKAIRFVELGMTILTGMKVQTDNTTDPYEDDELEAIREERRKLIAERSDPDQIAAQELI